MNSRAFSDFNQFSHWCSSLPEAPPDSALYINCHVTLVSSSTWQFLSLSLFSWPWVLRSIGHVFFRLSFQLVLPNIFLMIRLGLWVWGRNIIEVSCSSHYVISRVHEMYMKILVILTLVKWLRLCLLGFSTIKLLFFSFPILSLGSESLSPTTFKKGRWSMYINYLEFFCY